MNSRRFFRKLPLVASTLPLVELRTVRECYKSSFVEPNPRIFAKGYIPGKSDAIASVNYGVSPLQNRIYVEEIKVELPYRGRGYARSILLLIVQNYPGERGLMPITPMDEWETAESFWQELREGTVPGLEVTMQINGGGERKLEQQRWRLA
ncbi:MAG TPA: hypothetical protein VIM63_03865 [Rhodoferax sp.]|jgi:hypothetical protein